MIKKIGALSGLMTAGAIAVAAAVPASASQVGAASVTRPATSANPAPGPSGSSAQYTAGAPGYGATDSNGFGQATETTTLVRDADLFSSSYQPFVTLENSTSSTVTPEVELIPTATSSSAPVDSWYPNGDAGSASPTSFFWIQPTSSGTAYMTIADHGNGDEYLASLPYSTATSGALAIAHLGDVWLAAYNGQTFTAPRRPEDLNSFTSVTLTDTSGHTRPLGGWTHFERIMTSDGTAEGNTEIVPGPLSFDGKSFGLTVK